MKISLKWIKNYVDLPETLTMEKLSYDLTMRTVEVEGYESFREKYAHIVVGEILSVSPHPDADKLRVTSVNVGEGEPVQIVCGGSNLYEGEKVVVALPGAMVVWHGEGEPVKIKKTKMRGVESYGMICGADEVGLSDLFPPSGDHEIVDLKGTDCKAGDSVADVVGFDDEVLEIDNKSLTNRPDLYCHYGIARELAAIYGLELKELPTFEAPKVPEYEIKIEDPALCQRYVGMVFSGMENRPSPLWLKTALLSVGMRSINLIVDLTNYVMLSVGQPTHAFDKIHVKGGIVVRSAKKGETLKLLDDTVLELDETNLLIADHEKAIGLAGIMGGKDDSVLPETTEVVLEVANFNYSSVRHSLKEFDLRTEAAIRFEKSLDTQRVDQALGLFQKLLKELMPSATIEAMTDCYPVKTAPRDVVVKLSFLNERLGRTVTAEEVLNYLKPLGFDVSANGETLTVKVPSWRGTGDISLPDDVLEEVARMIGYENFELIHPTVRLNSAINQRAFTMERELREFLAFRAGFREIYTYPWIEDFYIRAAGMESEEMLALDNPPSPTAAHLRMSLIPGLLHAVEVNHNNFDEFRIFEMAHVFLPGTYSPSSPDEVLPVEEKRLAGAVVGKDVEKLFFTMKGVLEGFRRLRTEPIHFEAGEAPAWAEKKLCLHILSGEKVIGVLAAASVKALSDAGIKKTEAVFFELNVDAMQPLDSRTNRFEHLPLFPLVSKDFSVLIDETVTWAEMEAVIRPLVKVVRFMDEYRGRQIPSGKKSVMFRIETGSDERTLTSEDIEAKMEQIVRKLAGKFGAELRG